ncbi:uncharacterized protein E5676_scaffold68G00210 [Cucumis melo var. makuwa]|uniref:Uncharacterized protein n=1 Tax=Cucumis melo var. makuwa TaxID=1194695 RepID=A0A5A7SLB1_CUCMM|nr:uncharacterized protein E6C27_scaffold417G00490 [Cucumis melo var. makuwa]TYK04728.1 uncharacterized protein E5676_scaffold68G00210 [Cucumis melo var. makuwa]
MIEDECKVKMAGDAMKVSDRSRKLLMSMKRTQNYLYKTTLKTFKLKGEKKLAVGVPPVTQSNKLCEAFMITRQARAIFPALIKL